VRNEVERAIQNGYVLRLGAVIIIVGPASRFSMFYRCVNDFFFISQARRLKRLDQLR
jgi:hypothetical protein